MSEQTKLRVVLLSLWLLLLLPTLLLGYQTYQRLQFESLHQYRTLAETLSDGIAGSLSLAIEQESARDPAEYGFTVGLGVGAKRSPLSSLNPASSLPGILGFFQVDAQGELSSPVLPIGDGRPAQLAGLSVEELALRQLKLQSIENVLLQDLPAPSTTARPTSPPTSPPNSSPISLPNSSGKMADAEPRTESTSDSVGSLLGESESELRAQPERPVQRSDAAQAAAPSAAVSSDSLSSSSMPPAQPSVNAQRNQVLFEELSQADKSGARARDQQKTSAARKLELDTDFFSRSKVSKSKVSKSKVSKSETTKATNTKAKVSETKKSMPREAKQLAEPSAQVSTDLAFQSYGAYPSLGSAPAPESDAKVQASLFGSMVSDFELRALTANHLLLFRRVWQSQQPTALGLTAPGLVVQGLVLDRQEFFSGAITNAYSNSALAMVSDLAVAVDGQVQLTLAAGSNYYSTGTRLSGGELLYRRYLGSPFGNVELLFSARELPLAAGASLVLWTLLVLVSLLCAGFILLYILGKRQLQQRQQQQDFVSAVSHELKTPLTSIRMYGEMLKSGWVDEAKKSEYYDYIFNESERLSRLISNVLQLSSITRGRTELQLTPLSVAQILDLVRSRSAAQVKAQGYELSIACESGLKSAELAVDEDALLQVMINLIDNALKFSAGCERKELSLSVSREANGLAFALRDYGPGIEQGQLGKIFELFYRSENELTRETVGTGIGLALVQELVSAMGGRIAASNCQPGAKFVVRLPI